MDFKIINNIKSAFKLTHTFINPVGIFYHQFQFIARVLVLEVFLADLFKKPELECDVKNIGCKEVCLNRFAPMTHWRFWNMELGFWMVAYMFFMIFVNLNKKIKVVQTTRKKFEVLTEEISDYNSKNDSWKEAHSLDQLKADRKSMIKAEHSRTYLVRTLAERHSDDNRSFMKLGYFFYIISKIIFEGVFLKLELELNRNQSQKADFSETWKLPEKYLCFTHELNEEGFTLPKENRSDYFWRDSEILACSTNEHSVPCWIPKSRMKSYGLLLMYIVLVVNFVLSSLELIYFFTLGRKKFEKKKN